MADKFHRRPVAPGGFTQAPLTTTAVWRGITNSLATTAAQVADATPGLLAKASAGTKVVLEQNRQLWIDPLSEAVRDIAGDAKDAFRPGGAADAAAALRADARGIHPKDSLTSAAAGGVGPGASSALAPRPSPSVAAPVRDVSRERGQAARKLDAIFSMLHPGDDDDDDAVVRGGLNGGRGHNRRGGGIDASTGGGVGTSRDAAAPIAVDVGRGGVGPNDGSRRGDGPNDGSRLGDGEPNDPSVAAAFASIASARNRSFLDDVDRSGLVFWGCIGSFLTFSAVVAWRRHVAAATAGMNEEDLDAGGNVRRRLLEILVARLSGVARGS
jgi:hypothetical protein